MSIARPIITLTTDFGTSDHFAGAMKGVIASIAPRARIVDITHEIAPYEILGGAFVIAQAWRYFPRRTIHVVVVDPGVGSARRPILVEAGGHFFIAPDNGVLSMIYDAAKPKVREITNKKLMARDISRTFHGRDIFAPAVAHLASGIAAVKFGELIADFVHLATHPSRISKNRWSGMILKSDRFGNLITNFHLDELPDVRTRPFEIRLASRRIRRLALTFSDVEIGELAAVAGSSGFLEIVANQGSAAESLGCGSRTPVELKIYETDS